MIILEKGKERGKMAEKQTEQKPAGTKPADYIHHAVNIID